MCIKCYAYDRIKPSKKYRNFFNEKTANTYHITTEKIDWKKKKIPLKIVLTRLSSEGYKFKRSKLWVEACVGQANSIL